jgi:addiction module HigA family antidote
MNTLINEMYNPPHPGEILKELYLDTLGLTVTDAAQGLGVTRKTLSAIINQRQGISPEMALRLSKAFKTSPDLWIKMQMKFDLWKAQGNINLSSIQVFAA